MSLINCPECEKQISSTAKSCPNCGYKLKKSFIAKNKRIALFTTICIVAILFSILFIDWCLLSTRHTFISENDMLEYLNEQYWNISDDDSFTLVHMHDGQMLFITKNSAETYSNIEYNHKRGYFNLNNKKYILSKDDTLCESSTKYINGVPENFPSLCKQVSYWGISTIIDGRPQKTNDSFTTKGRIENSTQEPICVFLSCSLMDKNNKELENMIEIVLLEDDTLESAPFEFSYSGKNLSKIYSSSTNIIGYSVLTK